MKLPNLGKMVGPLPMGAWVAAVGGSVVVAAVVRKRKAGAPATAAVIPNGAVPFPGGGALSNADLYGATPLGGAANTQIGLPPITNNTEWERAAATALISSQGGDAYTVQQALRKYLRGLDALTAEEHAIVSAAVLKVGYPPQPPTVAPPPLPPTLSVPSTRTPTFSAPLSQLPTGYRYQVDRRPLDDPNGDPEVYVSVGGVYHRDTAATAIGAGIPVLERGWAYYLVRTGEAPAGQATIAYMNPATGYQQFGNA